ncbi:Multiple C2 and transmembrane domain-containing protein 2 [Blomia tropicalis]|nr:Multiple C2 and transmembrane domain-containing protein 2 [Blomia tropicalis]
MNDAENINLSSSPGSSRRINSVRFGTKRFQQIWLAMKRFSPIHRPNKYDHHYSSSAGTVRKRRKHSADSNDHNESSKMSNWSPFTRRRADNSTKSKRHRLYSSHPELSSTQLNDKDFLHETSKEETVNSESNRSPLNRIKKIKRDMQRCVQRMTSSGEFVAEQYSNDNQQDDGNVLVVESTEKKNEEKELVKIDKRRPLQRTTTIDQSSVDNLDDLNDENVEHVKNIIETRQQFNTEKITLEGAQNYDDLLQRQRISKLLKYPFYQVDIHLRNAINLLAKDSCGTSDPYVKFKVGNQIIHKSRIIFKTLNPNWDEYFVIPVDDIFEPILIKVYDHDYLSVDDYLGTVQVDLTKLDPGVSTDLSLFVQNNDLPGLQNIDKKWGQIFLTVKLNPKTQEEREHFYGRGKWTSMSGDGPMKKVRTQAFDSTVNILLIKAINMRLDTDYYIRFKLGTEKLKSKHVHKSVQSPYWAEQFDLRLFADQSKMLEITICGVSQSTSDFIYKSCIDLSDLEKEKTHHRMVQFEMEHQTSELEILLTITGNQQGLPNLLTTTDSNFSIRYNALHSLQNLSDVGQLIVKVYKAENLVAADINGKSDPFCVLELVNERLRTGTEYKTLSPEWNKMFSFNIMDIHEVLEVTVFDEDKDRSEFLGKVAIPLLKIRNGEKRWYALKDKKLQNRVKGHIQLEFWISYNRFKASIRTMTPREKKYIEPEVKFKRSLFVRNAIRLKNVCLELVEWGQFMHSCIQWESPIRSLVAFIFFLTFVYFFELYMFPLLLLIILLRNYLMLKIEKYFNPNRQEEEIGFIDDNEFEDVDDHDKASEEKKTLKEKLQTVQEVSTAVMNILGEMASFIERIKNTANFSVPFLSWLAIICLTLATILLFHIPIRYLILAWGVNKFTKKFRAPHAINNNEILDFLSRVPDIEQKIMYRDFKPNVQSDNRNVPSSPTITTSNNSSSTYNDRCKSSLSKNASFNSDKSNVSLSQFSYDKKKKEKRK